MSLRIKRYLIKNLLNTESDTAIVGELDFRKFVKYEKMKRPKKPVLNLCLLQSL